MKKLSLQALQKAVNTYLALDPESQTRLSHLEGKVVKVVLMGVNISFYWVFTHNSIQWVLDYDGTADTVLTGTPLRLLHMAVTKQNRQQFFSDDVSIQGNLELGQQVIALFDELEIDGEEIVSRWIGDTPAHFLGQLSRKFMAWTKQTRETVVMDMNEYIHEEVQLFPPTEAIQDFFNDVDQIRMDADRLEARLQLLQSKIKKREV